MQCVFGKFPRFGQNYKQGSGCAKFLVEIGLNFILIATITGFENRKYMISRI